MRGAVAAVAVAPAAAAAVAVAYRFPVPFGGYAHGFAEAGTAALACLFYLVLGGVPVLSLLGTLGGVLAAKIGATDARNLTLAIAASAALLAALALALLEFVVGPW